MDPLLSAGIGSSPSNANLASPNVTVNLEEEFSSRVSKSESFDHVAVGASSAVPTQSSSNPSYAEMIFSAITTLNEEDGSSKRAISKFIENTYSGLSESHSTLLTHHLKRLKTSGLLVMNKKSYSLTPRSDAILVPEGSLPPSDASANGSYAHHPEMRSINISEQLQDENFGTTSGQEASADLFSMNQEVQSPAASSGSKRKRGRPPKQKGHFQPFDALGVQNLDDCDMKGNDAAQPIFVALGLDDESAMIVKRGPGRPKKVITGEGDVPVSPDSSQQLVVPNFDGEMKVSDAALPVFVALGLDDDPTSVAKRGPGRPKRAIVGEGDVPVVTTSPQQFGVKKRRGRPPKSEGKLDMPREPKSFDVGGMKRGPGRPRKSMSNAQYQTALVNVPFSVDPALLSIRRPRGRPRKGAILGVGGIMHSKHLFRPKRKSTGRPVGRPRKNSLVMPMEANHSATQLEAIEDLKRKVEFIQSKIMEAVNVLKPEFSRESSVNAIAAIQELEGLASMDVTKPLQEEHFPIPTEI